MTSSCGSRVWSMISTACPSAASQIVRIARPATFIGGLPPHHPPGDRVEPGEEGGVAALMAGLGLARQERDDVADEGAGLRGIGAQHREDHVDRNGVVTRVPAIV